MKLALRVLIVIGAGVFWVLLQQLIGFPEHTQDASWYHWVFVWAPLYFGMLFGDGGNDINEYAATIVGILQYVLLGLITLQMILFLQKMRAKKSQQGDAAASEKASDS